MGPQRDTTNIIYTGGALLILNGYVQWEIDNAAIGVVGAIIGAALIVQRVLRNRKLRVRKGPRREKRP